MALKAFWCANKSLHDCPKLLDLLLVALCVRFLQRSARIQHQLGVGATLDLHEKSGSLRAAFGHRREAHFAIESKSSQVGKSRDLVVLDL